MLAGQVKDEAHGRSVGEQALQAQTALLPYALAMFGVSLPVYVWAGSHAANAVWMTGSFVTFAIAWGAFFAIVNWLKQPQAADPKRRARVQLLGGLLWAGAVAQIAAFADGAGPFRETLLLISLAAAVVCVVFTAPWLPSLLVVAPAALAGPLVALFSRAETREQAQMGWGATALALALALLVNRILRRQFALAAEREALMAERAEQAEAARRLARSKSDLVATLGDEIRNGLTGVAHVLAAAAGKGGRAAPSRAQLGAALDAANDLLDVLNTTLDAETAEAGRLTVAPQAFDAGALVRELAALARPQAVAKGLELAVHVEPELAARESGAAVADPGRVRQVLGALIGNAVKYTVRGRVEARISLAGPDRIAIEVVDTGPGLSEDELALAFEPFQRIGRVSAGAHGAGLGLTLARQLARLMGGTLRAHSAVGVGSCFTLELPYDPAAQRPVEERGEPASAQRGLRILVVEDDALSAAMLRAQLEQLGHQVVQAASDERACELARVCGFDLAMVAGAQTVRALAAITPVAALIGGDPDEASACLAAGAQALLRKPFRVPAVARAIAQAHVANHRNVA